MAKLIILLAIVLSLIGCGSLHNTANQAIAADALTTSVGVISGAAVEANPLVNSWQTGALLVGARIVAVEYINNMPEPARTDNLAGINAVTWGVVVNNLLAIGGASNPVSITIGIATGFVVWDATSKEREFMLECATYIGKGWTKQCIYKKE